MNTWVDKNKLIKKFNQWILYKLHNYDQRCFYTFPAFHEHQVISLSWIVEFPIGNFAEVTKIRIFQIPIQIF